MSEILNIPYTIAPYLQDRLGGIFLLGPVQPGQVLKIKGYTYQVTRCTPLQARFYVPSGIIKLDDLNGNVVQGGRLERLWKECGIHLRFDFVRAFFSECEVDDLVGKRLIYLAEFTENKLLLEK